ncbi:MAG: DUF1289 domain-containing protein [Alphaproteobacteria bacterium]
MSVIQSPCREICQVDSAGGACTGCGRTLTEIANWVRYTPAEREAIMRQLPARMAKGVRA